MEIFSFISKHKDFSQIYPLMIAAISVTTQNTTSSWMTLCIDVVSIPFFDDALPTRKMNKCWMIATLEHVAVIYLGWLQPRKSFTLAISSLKSLKTVTRLLRNAHLVNIFIRKSALILLCYNLSFPLAHFPNGGLIICIVSLYLSQGPWLHHCSHWLFYKVGWGHSYICRRW